MAGLVFHLLGPLTVVRDGAVLPLGGLKRRALLAVLVANRNRPVSVSAIIDAVWDDAPPPSGNASVQVAISGLRDLLGDRAEARILRTVAPGYQLTVPDADVDLARFRMHRDGATKAVTAGRLGEAGALFRAALDEWSGRALEDLRGLRFADELAVSLEEERLAALQARLDVDLRLGAHREVVGELATLTSDYPLHEAFWAQYMLALYRCGRQADALAAYRSVRAHLLDELGLEPSPNLRHLEAAMLAQSPLLTLSQPQVDETLREDVVLPPAGLLLEDGTQVPVTATGLRIGRMPGSAIVLDDPKASRNHAVVAASATGYVITDLHSTNGTRLGGEVVAGTRRLRDGDVIEIGSRRLVFRVDDQT
jgi:DNA-binding SARP family transcriptional activator